MSARLPRLLRSLRQRGDVPPPWLRTTPWFDAQWYLVNNPDVAAAGIDPHAHYWRSGMAEGRWPSPGFDAMRYEAMNPEARGRALVHFHHRVSAKGAASLQPAEVTATRHPELESGLFDARWYVARFPEAASAVHPFVHYASHGRDRLLPTGPLFDGATYVVEQAAALDAYTPLSHFVSGRGTGLTAPVLAEPTLRGPLVAPRIGRTSSTGVCVMIHAFYVDLLDELLRAVAPLAGLATVLVSVCDPGHVEVAHRAIDGVLGAGTGRVVKLVPNRGRNFAPLLVWFRDELRQHRVVLHLHSKKSLYSNSERADWRAHLLRCLAGPAIDAHLDLLDTHPEVGVVQPSMFAEMPPWSAHWLGNASNGRALFARCGLDPQLVDGYVDYPVGGMFWARVDALAPLLDAGLTVDDFEPEAGQTDGALAHAVERTITAAAVSRGYTFVEYDPDAAEFRRGWASRNTDSFGVYDIELLRRQISLVDLVSVDVFDTLVLRPTLSPTALQYFAARAVVDHPAEAESWVTERSAAEHRARVRHSDVGDVTLAEAFDELPRSMQPMQQHEIDIESRVAVSRRWLIDELRAAKQRGTRVVAMTDTTLPADVVRAVVAQVGGEGLFDEWYVSNERRARKDQGGMWGVVAASEGIPPQRWLHLGDNERSDIQQALTHSVGWSLVPSPRAVAQFHAPGGHLERGNWATQSALGLSATRLYDGRSDPSSEAVFGYSVLGPLVAALGAEVVRRRRDRPHERVLLMARDTALVYQVLQQWHADAPDAVPVVEYFQVSRRAALAASAAGGLDIDLVLDAGAFEGVFTDLVEARLGVRPEGEQFAVTVRHPAQRELCAALLAELAEPVRAAGEEQLAGLRRHLSELGIDDRTPMCVVDLGYSATTQRALARVLPNQISGLYGVTTPAGEATGAAALFGSGVRFWTGHWFLDHSLLLEALLSSTDGAVLGYRTDPTADAVVRAEPPVGVDRDRIGVVQTAARSYCADLLHMYGPAVLTDGIDATAVLSWVSRIRPEFLLPPTELFAGLRIENGFVGRPLDDSAAGMGEPGA